MFRYVECTSSAIQGLGLFRKLHPKHRRNEIDTSISEAINYIEETQNPDGSWYETTQVFLTMKQVIKQNKLKVMFLLMNQNRYGCWGICYTYGTWFAVEALASCGRNYHNSPTMRKACEFLLSKQLPNGGWGESYLSSQNKVLPIYQLL